MFWSVIVKALFDNFRALFFEKPYSAELEADLRIIRRAHLQTSPSIQVGQPVTEGWHPLQLPFRTTQIRPVFPRQHGLLDRGRSIAYHPVIHMVADRKRPENEVGLDIPHKQVERSRERTETSSSWRRFANKSAALA